MSDEIILAIVLFAGTVLACIFFAIVNYLAILAGKRRNQESLWHVTQTRHVKPKDLTNPDVFTTVDPSEGK